MAYEIHGHKHSLEAGADLSAKQFFFMAVAADGQIDPAGDGVAIVGVLQNKPAAAGRAGELVSNGVTKLVAGAVIALGADVTSDSAGKGKTAAPGDIVHAIALEAAAADLDVISVLVNQSRVTGDVELISGADLSTKQFLFHAIGTDGKIDPAGDGLVTCGILQNAPAAVDLAAICRQIGISSVISSAAFTAGDLLTPASTGKAKEGVMGDIIQAVALEDAGGADETVDCLLIGSGHIVA